MARNDKIHSSNGSKNVFGKIKEMTGPLSQDPFILQLTVAASITPCNI